MSGYRTSNVVGLRLPVALARNARRVKDGRRFGTLENRRIEMHRGINEGIELGTLIAFPGDVDFKFDTHARNLRTPLRTRNHCRDLRAFRYVDSKRWNASWQSIRGGSPIGIDSST